MAVIVKSSDQLWSLFVDQLQHRRDTPTRLLIIQPEAWGLGCGLGDCLALQLVHITQDLRHRLVLIGWHNLTNVD
jgi:hypothetical protein